MYVCQLKLRHSFQSRFVVSTDTQILSILNSGSVKDLQDLQTVGAKRARLIHAWRGLHGEFESFDDLTSVPGLTHRYLQSFLKVYMLGFLYSCSAVLVLCLLRGIF